MDDSFVIEVREFLAELVNIASGPALRHFRNVRTIDNKSSNNYDPVTDGDKETEDAIRAVLIERYPQHGITGEEREAHNAEAKYQWVIDPIDGTRAYICGLPTWATLVGLCEDGVPLLGLMSQPFVGEYFIGGGGRAERFYNQTAMALATSVTTGLAQASLFATAPDMFAGADEKRRFDSLSARVRLTRYGVDSYAYCLLAAGHIDIVAEAGLGFYDVAALIPIIEAAGGTITDWSGAPVRTGGTVVASSNPELHRQALSILQA